MKYYYVEDLQECGFMQDTIDEPMTLNDLRSRFWNLDDCRTEKFKEFTTDYIMEMWEVKFIEVDNKKINGGKNGAYSMIEKTNNTNHKRDTKGDLY